MLTLRPGVIGSLSGVTIVEANGKVLRGPDVSYYMGDGTTVGFDFNPLSGLGSLQVTADTTTNSADTTATTTDIEEDLPLGEDSTIDPAKTITSASQIQVHINGVEQLLNTHYTVDLGNGIHTADETTEEAEVVVISTVVNTQASIKTLS